MHELNKLLTVSTGVISSSGTSSGRNLAGVIQGNFSFTGRRVTSTSPCSGTRCALPVSVLLSKLTYVY